jgi:hypothetical protein
VSSDLHQRSVLAGRPHFSDDRHLVEPLLRFLDASGREPEQKAARGLRIEEQLQADVGGGLG